MSDNGTCDGNHQVCALALPGSGRLLSCLFASPSPPVIEQAVPVKSPGASSANTGAEGTCVRMNRFVGHGSGAPQEMEAGGAVNQPLHGKRLVINQPSSLPSAARERRSAEQKSLRKANPWDDVLSLNAALEELHHNLGAPTQLSSARRTSPNSSSSLGTFASFGNFGLRRRSSG